MDDPYRATRDVDLLASGVGDEAAVRATMETICEIPCPEDGLAFDLDSLAITPIRDEQRYAGQRAAMLVFLGKARIRLQVDFGFGDALLDAPEAAQLPTLIDRVPAPIVKAYPRIATVAEKFEAMVQLGRRNSRMKDFHDIWALSERFAFDGSSLRDTVELCFSRRDTPLTPTMPDALTPAFYGDPEVEARWRAYLRKGRFRASPASELEEVGDRIRSFLDPVRESIVTGTAFEMEWLAAGPWRPRSRAATEGDSDV
jgi:hypothetical protein